MSELKDLVVAVKDLQLDEQPDDTKSMADLPPEVVTIILEHLTKNESRNNSLKYRLVNSQWCDIIGPILEQRIISGSSQVFPTLRIYRHGRQDLLHVSESPTLFPASRNPFPFNSLTLNCDADDSIRKYFRGAATDLQTMRDLMSSFGGFLTSFELQDVIVPGINSLIILLSSMTSLKVLSFREVKLPTDMMKQMDVLPAPPPLPNLSVLLVKSGRILDFSPGVRIGPGVVKKENHILYVWLIASYADQLLKLEMDMDYLSVALQPRLHYYYSFHRGKTVSIATTTDSAFQSLKELKIQYPVKDFLRLSELSQLQQLSVTNLDDRNPPNLLDITEFISKCRNTLEKLRLDKEWFDLIGWDASERLHAEGILPPILESPVPKLKQLEIHYTTEYYEINFSDWYTTISRFVPVFLALFPSLEALHFLQFPSFCISQAHEIINGTVGAGQLPIAAVKTRFASLETEVFERIKNFQLQHAQIRLEVLDQDELEEHLEHLKDQMYRAMRTFNAERAQILSKSEALGVKKQNVVVEHFLESQGVWNTCPKLKLVSVSSGGIPDGDVCIIRRPEEV